MNSDEDTFSFMCAQETTGILEVLEDSSSSLPDHNPSMLDEVLLKASSDIKLTEADQNSPTDVTEDNFEIDSNKDALIVTAPSNKSKGKEDHSVMKESEKPSGSADLDEMCTSRKHDESSDLEDVSDSSFVVEEEKLSKVSDTSSQVDVSMQDSPSELVGVSSPSVKENEEHSGTTDASKTLSKSDMEIEKSSVKENCDDIDTSVKTSDSVNDLNTPSGLLGASEQAESLDTNKPDEASEVPEKEEKPIPPIKDAEEIKEPDSDLSHKNDHSDALKMSQDVPSVELVDLEETTSSENKMVSDVVVESSDKFHPESQELLHKLEETVVVTDVDMKDAVRGKKRAISDLLGPSSVEDSGLSESSMGRKCFKADTDVSKVPEAKSPVEPDVKQRKLDVILLEEFPGGEEIEELSTGNGIIEGKSPPISQIPVSMVEDLEDIIVPHVLVATHKNSPSTTDNEEKRIDMFDSDSSSSSSGPNSQPKEIKAITKDSSEKIITKDSKKTVTSADNKTQHLHNDWSESSSSSWETKHRTKTVENTADKNFPGITSGAASRTLVDTINKRKCFSDDWSDSSDSSWETAARPKEDLYSGVTSPKYSTVNIVIDDVEKSSTVDKKETDVSDSSNSSLKITVTSNKETAIGINLENKTKSVATADKVKRLKTDTIDSPVSCNLDLGKKIIVNSSNDVDITIFKESSHENTSKSDIPLSITTVDDKTLPNVDASEHSKHTSEQVDQPKIELPDKRVDVEEDKNKHDAKTIEPEDSLDKLLDETVSSPNQSPISDKRFDDSVEDLISALSSPVGSKSNLKHSGRPKFAHSGKKVPIIQKDPSLFTPKEGKKFITSNENKQKYSDKKVCKESVEESALKSVAAIDTKGKQSGGNDKSSLNSTLKQIDQAKATVLVKTSNKDSVGENAVKSGTALGNKGKHLENSEKDSSSSKQSELSKGKNSALIPLKDSSVKEVTLNVVLDDDKRKSDKEPSNLFLKQSKQSEEEISITRESTTCKDPVGKIDEKSDGGLDTKDKSATLDESISLKSPLAHSGRSKVGQYITLTKTPSGTVTTSVNSNKTVAAADTKISLLDPIKSKDNSCNLKKSNNSQTEASQVSAISNQLFSVASAAQSKKSVAVENKIKQRRDSKNDSNGGTATQQDKYKVGHSYFVVKESRPPCIIPNEVSKSISLIDGKEKDLVIDAEGSSQSSLISSVLEGTTRKTSAKNITAAVSATKSIEKTILVGTSIVSMSDITPKDVIKPSTASSTRSTRKVSVSDIVQKDDCELITISAKEGDNLITNEFESSNSSVKQKDQSLTKIPTDLVKDIVFIDTGVPILTIDGKGQFSDASELSIYSSEQTDRSNMDRSDTDASFVGSHNETDIEIIEPEESLVKMFQETESSDHDTVTPSKKERSEDSTEDLLLMLEDSPTASAQDHSSADSSEDCEIISVVSMSEKKENVELQKETRSQVEARSVLTTRKRFSKVLEDAVEKRKGEALQLVKQQKKAKRLIKEPKVQEDTIKESKIQKDTIKESRIQKDTIKESKIQKDMIKEPKVQMDTSKEPKVKKDMIKEPKVQKEIVKTPKVQKDVIKEPKVQKDMVTKVIPKLNKIQTRASKNKRMLRVPQKVVKRALGAKNIKTTIKPQNEVVHTRRSSEIVYATRSNEIVHATRSKKRGAVVSAKKENVNIRRSTTSVKANEKKLKRSPQESFDTKNADMEQSLEKNSVGRPRRKVGAEVMRQKKTVSEPVMRTSATRSGNALNSPETLSSLRGSGRSRRSGGVEIIATPIRRSQTRKSVESEITPKKKTPVASPNVVEGTAKKFQKKVIHASSNEEAGIVVPKRRKKILRPLTPEEMLESGFSSEEDILGLTSHQQLRQMTDYPHRELRLVRPSEVRPCIVKLKDVARFSQLKLQEASILGEISKNQKLVKLKGSGASKMSVGNEIKAEEANAIRPLGDSLQGPSGFSYMTLKRNLFKITLPSILWARQVETNGRFVSFTRISSDSGVAKVYVDKGVMFEGSCEPAVFFREKRVYLPVAKGEMNSLEAVSDFLLRVHRVAFCVGGLQRGVFSKGCRGYVDAPNPELRCSACVTERKTVLAVLNRRLSKRVSKPNTRFLT